jgi:hypothetical protein
MIMTNDDCYKILREFNKWRRGRGKKYSAPGFPFSATDIGYAIDRAIACVKAIRKAEKILEKTNEPTSEDGK